MSISEKCSRDEDICALIRIILETRVFPICFILFEMPVCLEHVMELNHRINVESTDAIW